MSLDFLNLTRRGLLTEHVWPAETWEGQSQERAEGARPKKEVIEYREATNLSEFRIWLE